MKRFSEKHNHLLRLNGSRDLTNKTRKMGKYVGNWKRL